MEQVSWHLVRGFAFLLAIALHAAIPVTKSDVLGHLAYMVGRDWTHAGVAQLFSSIRSNGYQVCGTVVFPRVTAVLICPRNCSLCI
jgi:hypothetical protein